MTDAHATTTSSRRIPALGLLVGVVSFALLAKTLLSVASHSSLPFRERHGLNAILVCAFFTAIIAVVSGVAAVVGKKLNRVVCVFVATAAGTMAALLYQKVFGAVGGLLVGLVVAAGIGRPIAVATLWVLAAAAAGSLAGFAGFAVTNAPVDPLVVPTVIIATTLVALVGSTLALFIRSGASGTARLQRMLCGGFLLLLPFGFGTWVGLSIDTLWRVRLIERSDVFRLRTTPVGIHWLSEGVFDVQGIGMSPLARESDVVRLKRFRHLFNFSTSAKQFTDDGLRYVSELSGLPHLNVDSSSVSDAGLVHLREMTGLQSVRLTHTRVTGEGLPHLCPTLGGLSLDGSPITDDGLRHVQHLTSLGWLHLAQTQVTDRGLEYLRPLATIKRLSLGGTHVSDAGLERLGTLSSLTHLYLNDTPITGVGLHHLKSLPSLTYLSLANTPVTDEGLRQLETVSSLTHLDLEGTQVSEAAIEELRKALPMMRIDSPKRRAGQ